MRPFIAHDVDQRSKAWHTLRLGKLTSTGADAMLSTRKDGKEAAGRRNLLVRLALEQITGRSCERDYQSGDMRHGQVVESEARSAYEVITGQLLQSTGFLSHPELAAGTSLDGLLGDLDAIEGITELKCPLPATHLDYLKTGKVPLDYQRQVTHALWISGAPWCDWMSYCAEFPEELRTKIVRVPRVEADIAAYELMARAFLADVDREVATVRQMMERAA